MGTRKALIDTTFFPHALDWKNQIYGPLLTGRCDTHFIRYQFILHVGEELLLGDANIPHFHSVDISYKDYHPSNSLSHSTTERRVRFLMDLTAATQKLLIKTEHLDGICGEAFPFFCERWCYFISCLSKLDSHSSLISAFSQK